MDPDVASCMGFVSSRGHQRTEAGISKGLGRRQKPTARETVLAHTGTGSGRHSCLAKALIGPRRRSVV